MINENDCSLMVAAFHFSVLVTDDREVTSIIQLC